MAFDFENRAEKRETSPKRAPVTEGASEVLRCPKCGQGQIIKSERGYGCNRYHEGCDFVVWKGMAGKKLTEKQIVALIGKGRTGLIKGFRSRAGNRFDARLRLDTQWKVVLAFTNRERQA